eukprot:760816-Hanusia_phi.AAC.4
MLDMPSVAGTLRQRARDGGREQVQEVGVEEEAGCGAGETAGHDLVGKEEENSTSRRRRDWKEEEEEEEDNVRSFKSEKESKSPGETEDKQRVARGSKRRRKGGGGG